MSASMWFVDTWAAQEGVAFASHREPMAVSEWRRSMSRTVCIRAPQFD